MVISQSRFSYGDCYSLMDKALADAKGIKIRFASYEDALHFRMRLHTSRKIDRQDNTRTYSEEHVMHGKSAYDPLIMRIKTLTDGTAWLRMEKVDAREFTVESLADEVPQKELEFDRRSKILEVQPVIPKPRPQVLMRRRI